MRAIAWIAVAAAACGGSNQGRFLRITGPAAVLDVQAGGTLQLTAAMSDGSALPGAVTWTSSNPSVATVDPTGLVTTLANGSTSISASAGGMNTHEWVSVGATVVEWSLPLGQAGVTTTVAAGTPIRWHAVDMTHTVNPTVAAPPDALNVAQGTTSDPEVFAAPGRYTYRCAIHPSMTGTVLVQ